MKPIRIAIALGADSLTAVARVGTTRHVDRVELVGAVSSVSAGGVEDAGGSIGRVHDDGSAAALAAAIARLSDRLTGALGRPLDGARVRVAVLPPLVSARLIELPPLGRAEAEAVVRRSARRYFPLVTRTGVIALREPDGKTAGARAGKGGPGVLRRSLRRLLRQGDTGEAAAAAAPGNWLAFGVDAEWIDAIRAAVEGANWQVDAVVPAHAAWLAAAEAVAGGKALDAVVAVEGGTGHVLRLEGGTVTALRRAPGGGAAGVAGVLGRGPGTVALFADPEARQALRDALAEQGWNVVPLVAGRESAASLAAEHAYATSTELVSAGLALARQRARRRLAVRLGAAAVVVLAAAAGLELWDARRDLDEIRAERAAIREEVRPMAELRDSLQAFEARARAVLEIEGLAPRWTPVLVELARILPRDSHVQRLHARGDTVSIQVVSGRAGPALAQLRQARTLRNVELNGVVDRQMEGGTTTSERFTVSALLARDTTAAAGGIEQLDGRGMR